MTDQSDNFFIFDCEGNIVGNPKGYRTMKGAQRQQNSHNSKVYRQLWGAYENRTGAALESNLVSKIAKLDAKE